MNPREARALVNLADRLGSTPGQVLIAAARMTESAEPDVVDSLSQIRADGIHRNVPADQCVRLMLTPVDSYARDSLDSALVALWQGSGQTD